LKLKILTKVLLSTILILVIIGGSFAVPVFAYTSQRDTLIDYFSSQASSLQEYVDSALSKSAGTTHGDWLFIGLTRLIPELKSEKYLTALEANLNKAINKTDNERIALIYSMCGQQNSSVNTVLSYNANELTVNELIYALILIDSSAYKSPSLDRNTLLTRLLAMQLTDGGWALTGNNYDIDVTAMALQALAPYTSFKDVSDAVKKALSLLSAKQTENGDYKSRGTPTCESTAQVIIALHSLGIDPKNDTAFIKNGKNLYDGLSLYATAEGGYSHFVGGKTNGIATAQATCALASAYRFETGTLGIYRFTSISVPRELPQDSSNSSEGIADDSSSNAASSELSSAQSSSVSAQQHEGSSIIHSQESPYDTFEKVTKKISYKYIACSAVIILFMAVTLVLFIKGKANAKNILPIAFLALLIICGILFINISSVKEHYSADIEEVTDGSPTISLTIKADVITDRDTSLPADGYILPEVKYVLEEGTTPFSVLLDLTLSNGIKLIYSGSPDNPLAPVYISSIANISEQQYGPLSGWIYKVNGISPDVSCSEYPLKDGDTVEWVYTLDLGKDAENNE